MRRTAWERSFEKRQAVNAADASGQLADSTEVRMALLEKVKTGECTLAEVQEELKRIKRNAKKNGLLTRDQAWRNG